MSTSTPSAGPGTGADDRLESWKEIAVFLRRDIRTVQRWEKTEHMPVHRHVHDKLGSIYAFKSELTEWQLQRTAVEDVPEPVPEAEAPDTPPEPKPLKMFRWWHAVAAAVAVAAVIGAVYLAQRPPSDAKILVLPFANLSGDAAQEYFSDGVTEELITSLGRQTDGMHVTSLGSSL